MALFEKEESKKQYLVLLDKNGENVVAYVNPANKVKLETLVDALEKKGLQTEVRDVQPDIESLEL